jgi:hypothetical protein
MLKPNVLKELSLFRGLFYLSHTDETRGKGAVQEKQGWEGNDRILRG